MTHPAFPRQLEKGDVVSTPTRNPLVSTAVWGLIVILAARLASHYLPDDLQQPAIDAALEVLSWGVGPAMVLWGRWTAAQPLGVTDTHKQKTLKCLLPLLVLPMLTGCGVFGFPRAEAMSDGQKLYAAKSALDSTLAVTVRILEAGVVADQKTKDAIWLAKSEAVDGLADAEATFKRGDKANFNFYLRRVHSALDRLARINLNNSGDAPEPGPASRSRDVWVPQQSSRSWSTFSRRPRSSRTSASACRRATSRPTMISARSTRRSPQRVHALMC